MKRWHFAYHFPHALVKHANQNVTVEASNWRAAGAKADREVAKRKGIKGLRSADIYKRACYPASKLVSTVYAQAPKMLLVSSDEGEI